MKYAARCLLALLLCAPAFADVVKLKTGGTISGKIVSEDDEKVVVKTPKGKVTLPRHMIAEVVKQSAGETALALARERVKSGAYEDAERLFLEAAKDPNPAVSQKARTELAYFRARLKRVQKFRQPPRTPWTLPEGIEGKPIEGETLQEQFDRARRAIEREDGRRALRLLEPLAAAKPDDVVLRFLVARGHQLAGEKAKAREAVLDAFGVSTYSIRERPLEWLVELSRRELAGEKLSERSPGMGSGTHRIGSEHFAIYHALPSSPQWAAQAAELAYQDVLEAFHLKKRDVYIMGKVQVFLFPTQTKWVDHEVWGQPEAHGVARAAPDGTLRIITAYPDQGFFRSGFVHEVAHAIVDDVYPGLPLWIREGAAAFACPPDVRAALREKALATPPDVKAFVKGEVTPPVTRRERRIFRAQSALLFEVLAKQFSPRRTLKLGQEMARKDPEKVLLYSQFSLRDFAKAVKALSEGQ